MPGTVGSEKKFFMQEDVEGQNVISQSDFYFHCVWHEWIIKGGNVKGEDEGKTLFHLLPVSDDCEENYYSGW